MTTSIYDFLSDPSNAALLGASAGLLTAGGPSPYPNRFGPALGTGIMTGMQAGTQARDAQLKQGLMAEQLKRAIEQGKMLDLLQKSYAAQGAVGQPQPQPGLQQAALGMGASQGSVGPTNQNAALLNTMQSQAPQPQQTPTPSYFNARNLFIEGRLATLAGIEGGPGMMTAALSHDPDLKRAGASPMAVRPGGTVFDPVTQRPMFYAPNVPQGSTPLYGPRGDVTAVTPLPGAEEVQRIMAAASAGGQAPYQFHEVTDSQGRRIPMSTSQLMGAPGASSAAGPRPGLGITPLADVSQRTHAAELEKQYGTWQNEANSAQQDNLLIDRMRAESQGFSPGKMAESYGNLQAYLVRIPGMDTPERKAMLGDFQAFQKNATQLSTSAARTMGAREPGSVIAMFKNAYPNADLTSNAMNAMFTQIQGLNDYKSAKQSAADGWRGGHQGTLDGFQSQWNKTADPMFFVVQRMPADVRQQFFAKMSPTERQSFEMKYRTALNSGFLPPAQ